MRLAFLSQGIIERHKSVRLDIQNKNFVRVQTFMCHFYRRANGLPVNTPYVFRREAYRNDLVTWKEISGVVHFGPIRYCGVSSSQRRHFEDSKAGSARDPEH
jgi:hypothetical protein